MRENQEFSISESAEKYNVLRSLVEEIERVSDSAEISLDERKGRLKELVSEMLDHMEEDLDLEFSPEVTRIYSEMSQKDLLARVESIKNVIDCLSINKPIHVGDSDHHYANCVTSDKDGLRIAMAEAEALGPVRLLMGLDLKALIGFNNDHIQVAEIDDNEFDLRDTTLRKIHCRHIVGDIYTEDIKYLVLRIPRQFFPESKLSDEERNFQGNFIFRGARIESTEVLRSEIEIAA